MTQQGWLYTVFIEMAFSYVDMNSGLSEH